MKTRNPRTLGQTHLRTACTSPVAQLLFDLAPETTRNLPVAVRAELDDPEDYFGEGFSTPEEIDRACRPAAYLVARRDELPPGVAPIHFVPLETEGDGDAALMVYPLSGYSLAPIFGEMRERVLIERRADEVRRRRDAEEKKYETRRGMIFTHFNPVREAILREVENPSPNPNLPNFVFPRIAEDERTLKYLTEIERIYGVSLVRRLHGSSGIAENEVRYEVRIRFDPKLETER